MTANSDKHATALMTAHEEGRNVNSMRTRNLS